MKQTIQFKTIIYLVLLVGMLFLSSNTAYAATTKEDLIESASNPSNGKISFYINAPAKTEVNYRVRLVPNNKNAAIDTKSGRYKNTSTEAVRKKITVSVNYYSRSYKYDIEANYTRKRKSYKDTDKVTSAIPRKTFYSDKFTWTKENIEKYKNNKTAEVVMAFATGAVIDILVTKGKCTAAIASLYSAGSFFSDIVASRAAYDIRDTMIEGWGYKVKAVPNSSRKSYHVYLLVYNKNNQLVETVDCGTKKVIPIMHVIR